MRCRLHVAHSNPSSSWFMMLADTGWSNVRGCSEQRSFHVGGFPSWNPGIPS